MRERLFQPPKEVKKMEDEEFNMKFQTSKGSELLTKANQQFGYLWALIDKIDPRKVEDNEVIQKECIKYVDFHGAHIREVQKAFPGNEITLSQKDRLDGYFKELTEKVKWGLKLKDEKIAMREEALNFLEPTFAPNFSRTNLSVGREFPDHLSVDLLTRIRCKQNPVQPQEWLDRDENDLKQLIKLIQGDEKTMAQIGGITDPFNGNDILFETEHLSDEEEYISEFFRK